MRLSGSGYNLGYSQLSTAQNGKISLPVSNRALIYSFYKHVQGYSVSGNSPTVPLSKISILDNLIDSLSKMKGEAAGKTPRINAGGMSSEAIDHLIDNYAKELHQVVLASQSGFNAVETGMVVSLTA